MKNTKSYFRYVFSQNWQHLIFYIILLLLAVVLPTVMNINEFNGRKFDTIQYAINKADAIVGTISAVFFFVSCCVALFAGMSAFSYVNSKQAVGCFHSFPITRRTIYLTETIVKALYFLISFFLTLGMITLLMELNLPMEGNARLIITRMIPVSLASFCLVYAITLFAAGLCGTGLLRFLMTGVTALLPLAVYFLVCASAYFGMPDIDFDAYINLEILKWMSPIPFLYAVVYKAIGELEQSLLLDVFLVLLPAAAFYLGGYILHQKRRSEGSGNSIVWKPVFIFIKYAMIFVCTICGGALFGSGLFFGTEDGLWYLFGALFGLILSFLLVNVILYRSVRAMFKGLRGLAVMAVCMVLFTSVTVYDVLGINEHVYSPGNTRSITLRLSGDYEITYDDREDLDLLVPLLDEYMAAKDETRNIMPVDGSAYFDNLQPVDQRTQADMLTYMQNYLVYDEEAARLAEKYGEYTISYSPSGEATATEEYPVTEPVTDLSGRQFMVYVNGDSCRFRWVQKAKFGITSCKSVNIEYCEETKPIYEFIYGSDEFAEAINQTFRYEPEKVREMELALFNLNDSFYVGTSEKGLTPAQQREKINEMYQRLGSVYRFSNETRMSSPVVGRIRIWIDGVSGVYQLPIYAEDVAVINVLADYFVEWTFPDFGTVEDIYDYMAEDVDAMFLIDAATQQIVSLDDAAQKEVLRWIPEAGYRNNAIVNEVNGTEYAVVIARAEYNDVEKYTNVRTCEYMIRPGCGAAVARFLP